MDARGHAFIADMKNTLYENFSLNFALDAMGIDESVRGRIKGGNHPDFIKVYPDGASIKINQVRNIIAEVATMPYEGGRRVIVFFDADSMLPPTQNSLLKTLEEPPQSTIFLLLCQNYEKLLPTICSRCFRIRNATKALAVEENIFGEIYTKTLSCLKTLQAGQDGLYCSLELSEKKDELALIFSFMLSYYSDALRFCTGAKWIENPGAEEQLAFFKNKEAQSIIHCIEFVTHAISMLSSNVSPMMCAQWLCLKISEEIK